MERRFRPHQPWISTLLICTFLLLNLTGCGGSSGATNAANGNGALATSAASSTSALATLDKLPRVSGQDGDAALLEGRVTVVGGVAGAEVSAYLSDGTALGSTTTDADGAFELYIPLDAGRAWVQYATKSVGLAPDELRVFVTVPDGASEGAGTTLMADLPWGFAHVSHVTTEVSLLRQRIAPLTLAAAERAVKTYHVIPERIDLENVGGDYTPFSDRAFMRDALAFNVAAGRAGSANEDAYLLSQVAAMAAGLAPGAKAATMPRAQKLANATGDATDGAGRSLNDDKTDPEGSLDPSQQNAPGRGIAFTPSPALETLDLNAYMNKLTISNAIITSVTSTVGQIADFYILVDAANGNNAQSKWTKALAWVGIGSVLVAGVAQIAIAILSFQANDPYLDALQQVSQQINQGFAALSQQLQATQDYLDFRISQNSYATTLSDIQAKLTLIASRQTAPTNGMVTFATAQADAAALNSNPQGLTYATRMANYFNGSGGSANTVLQGNRAYTAQYTYTPAPAKQRGQAKADSISYPLRGNGLTLALRPLVMQFANALDYAEQVDAFESKAILAQFSNPMTSLTALSDRLLGSTPSFGANGVMALRRRGLQQAPPRFASDKLWVEPGQELAWSTESATIPADDKNVKKTIRGGRISTYSYVIDGASFKPTAYRLNGEMAGLWRLPTIEELRRLPGWGKGGSTCVDRLKAEMGITVGGWWFAAYDPTAPTGISSSSSGYGYFADATVSGQVRFWDSSNNLQRNGLEVAGFSGTQKSISCLRVFDARNLAQALGEGAVAVFPSNDLAAVAVGGARVWQSSALRSAGIAPDDIKVFDRVVNNPWYVSSPKLPFMAARKIHALSAVAIWHVNPVGGRPAVIIDDVSGVVEWQSSNTAVARIDNSFNRAQKVSDDARVIGNFVSPWFATLTFSGAGTVTVTARWTQGTTSATPRNTVSVTEATSADLCIPPVVTSIGVTPANMLSTLPADLHGKTMSAWASLSDSSGLDVTGRVQWSLLEVLLDGSGHETGTAPLSAAVATISQNGGGLTGGILSITGGSGTAKRIRIVATDPVSGKVGTADFQLQFP